MKDPDLSMHPDLPKCFPYNLDPFVVSETHPDNFSFVEDDSKPHAMWFSDIHANKRSIKLCIAHSHGSTLLNRLMHPVGSRNVEAWSSSELQLAVCLSVSSAEMKQNERVAINTHMSSVQVPHVSFMQMQLCLLPVKETLPLILSVAKTWPSLNIWAREILDACWPPFYLLLMRIAENVCATCSKPLFIGSLETSSTLLYGLTSWSLQ